MSTSLCLWSGPRNISTAMMRSFGAREDTQCWDEPFCGAYLANVDYDYPDREVTTAAWETDPNRVAKKCAVDVSATYHFQKHMSHHILPSFPLGWASEARHVFILRHPARVIASYAKGRPKFTTDTLGFSGLRELHRRLTDMTHHQPLIVETDSLLADPETHLRQICEIGFRIPFDPAMLSWEPGPRPEDGPWAPWWYANVIKSTGFGPPPGPLPEVAPAYHDIYLDCLADYEALRALG